MAPKPRGKREKLPFWKRLPPELHHVADHIGRIVDNARFLDIIEAATYAGVAYLGYKVFGDKLEGSIIGLVGLKLATTGGGTPPVSQIAGIVTLSSMGLAGLAGQQDYLKPDELPPITGGGTMLDTGQWAEPAGYGYMVSPTKIEGKYVCPVGFKLVFVHGGAIMCQKYAEAGGQTGGTGGATGIW